MRFGQTNHNSSYTLVTKSFFNYTNKSDSGTSLEETNAWMAVLLESRCDLVFLYNDILTSGKKDTLLLLLLLLLLSLLLLLFTPSSSLLLFIQFVFIRTRQAALNKERKKEREKERERQEDKEWNHVKIKQINKEREKER